MPPHRLKTAARWTPPKYQKEPRGPQKTHVEQVNRHARDGRVAMDGFCSDTDLVADLATNKKALVSEGFNDKQVLDLVGCAGKI